ncbi:FAD-binding protein [Olsenella sp. YH-ols2217]|uniref:FAD-binding protein n=1 Tax=Kribbibacterium absianum TaxID=3044210 RepID=A0ABT6ZMC7_9ACTN|nr:MULTISPECIES: FAD-binding protein [unclassified Olsenella]MDJ1122194.1 FAD-binding protein [Olsenella sp. YH-ols2216]MDJ1130202.1 FAD-binding protein [Olsenella sp. YH-ols2217]
MLEVPNIAVHLGRIDVTDPASEAREVRRAAAKRLGLKPRDVNEARVLRRSIDARRGHEVRLIYTAAVSLKGGASAERALLAGLERRHREQDARPWEETVPTWPEARPCDARPVVVGAGCAGLFCALALAEAGLRPVLIERGDDVDRRSQHVARFNETGRLDTESNIQFGLGGAGTFSDGKLATGTKSPLHRLVLETFVQAGAPADILVDAKPHVGSDLLPGIVARIVGRIRSLGGEVRFRCRLTGLETAGTGDARRVVGVRVVERGESPSGRQPNIEDAAFDIAPGVEREERIAAGGVVLATGHSARDVFELLRDCGAVLERKTFAMGVRIEHLQAQVDECQYGPAAGNPLLGAAPYKLVSRVAGGRSAYSFCMCPGGEVVAAASEPWGVVTNGMSLSARAGLNANAGLLVNVNPSDLPGEDVLAGVALQRECEQAAYRMGGGAFRAPAQLVGDFLQRVASSGPGHVQPTYPRGVTWGEVDGCLPGYVTDALRANLPLMAKKLRCFADPEAVLTGVESRSSSPVRVVRGPDGQAPTLAGLFPCGEGAGYAGGIMSAATDGIETARSLVAWLAEE